MLSYTFFYHIKLQNPTDNDKTIEKAEDETITHSTELNILETFEEKQIKTKALMEQFIMYCVDGNYFPFLFVTTIDDCQQMQQFVNFFKHISNKLSTICKVYQLENIPEDVAQNEHIEIPNHHVSA